jgi:hypothetical protein
VDFSKASAERLLRERGWLALLPEPFRAEVLRRAELVRFAAGDVVYRLGDPQGGSTGSCRGSSR